MRRKLHTQHGIATREQLLRAGLSSQTIQRWLKAGHLIPLHRGVYAVGHLPPSPYATTMAALLACGPTAVLSHRSAAKLWGLIRYDGPIEVTAANTRRRHGINVHRHRPHPRRPVGHPHTGRSPAPSTTPACATRSSNHDARPTHHHLPTAEVNTIVAGYEVDMLWRPQH